MVMQSVSHQSSKFNNAIGPASGHTARIISKKLSASKIKITDKRSNNFDFPNQQSSMLDITAAAANEHASQSMVLEQQANMLNNVVIGAAGHH